MSAPRREDVERFKAVLVARLGLQFEGSRDDDVAECLARRAAAGSRDAASYVDSLHTAGGPEELRAVAEQLTVGETYFFRNANHFRAFAGAAFPDRARTRRGRPVRILSAGCASGEEAYTAAMIVRDGGTGHAVQITGIDVNPAVLRKARGGRYSAWSLRATPPEARDRWFSRAGDEFVLDPEIVEMATFAERNLLDEDETFWGPDTFDVIFCRNVLIYFSHEAMQATIARFARSLGPGGFLFLGDAENLRGVSHDFHLQHTDDTFYYRVREGEAAATRAAAPGPALRAPMPVETAAPLPSDASWVDAIHEAADRIARLADTPGPRAAGTTRGTPAPAAPAPTRHAAADGLLAATLLLKQERYTEALGALDALPADVREDADVQMLRAGLCVNQGDLAAARLACGRVLERDELNAGAHYLLALCDEHAGDLEAAAEHDRVAAYLDATFAMPRLHLGRLLRRRGDVAAARGELSRALDLLGREETTRVLLFGGGFGREALAQVCRAELRACGEAP